MTKTNLKLQDATKETVDMTLAVMPPLSCTHYERRSEIAAFVGPDGQKQVIGETFDGHNIDAAANAELLVRHANYYFKLCVLVGEMEALLKACAADGHIGFSLEQDIESVMEKIQPLLWEVQFDQRPSN